MAVRKITTPLTEEVVRSLRAGDAVAITGVIYQARDAAHKKLVALVEAGEALPFELQGAVVYYMGPSPAKPGNAIGSAGPTTSGRMDAYAPLLMRRGLKGMIGKGLRTAEVKQAMRDETAVYFAATGGAGALLAKRIVGNEVIAWPELGAEAVARLDVVDFPAIVVNDCHGGDLYEEGRAAFAGKTAR
jgi:fumarate hydratase subunit beta